MEKVYVVTGPQRFADFDHDKADDLTQELKMSALDGIEAEWRAEQDKKEGAAGYDYDIFCSLLNLVLTS